MTPAIPTMPPMPTHEAKQTSTAKPQTYEVIAVTLYLRSDAGMDNAPIDILYNGEEVTRTSAAAVGDWWEVVTLHGFTGWVNSQYIIEVK